MPQTSEKFPIKQAGVGLGLTCFSHAAILNRSRPPTDSQVGLKAISCLFALLLCLAAEILNEQESDSNQ